MIGDIIHITGTDRRTGDTVHVRGVIVGENETRTLIEYIDGADDGLFAAIPNGMIRQAPPPLDFHDDEPDPGEGWKNA